MRARLHIAQNVAFASLFSPFDTVASSFSQARSPRLLRAKQLCSARQRSISTPASPVLRNVAKVSEGPNPLIFESTSTNPYHNLAIEDYLLRNSDHSSRILLFYTNRPCVVIGRNQNPWLECNLQRLQDGLPQGEAIDGKHATRLKSNNRAIPIDLVRRRSGGGTVFHDLGNLNYSVIVPNDKDFNRRKHAEMVVRGLDKLNGHDLAADIKVNERHDIVMQKPGQEQWLKVSGSAFKLTRGRALHHGTLLYSSPYLHQISGLLRSPGRGLIQAKGVESVRSKVGNLTWLEKDDEGQELKRIIIDNITVEFLSLYGIDSDTQPQTTSVSDEDCQAEMNAVIAAGVEELMSNDWRFGQTPRFDFDSGLLDGSQLQFHSNRGLIETWKVREVTSKGTSEAEGKASESIQLHGTNDWQTVVKSLQPLDQFTGQRSSELKRLSNKAVQARALMDQIESIFPPFD